LFSLFDITGIFGVPKQMCAAMYLKGILEFSSMNDRGRLEEFHIIDIHDDVLDMVKVWHEKFKGNPRCLEYNAVLAKVTDNWKQSKSNKRHHWSTEENNGRHGAGERSMSGFTNSLKDKGNHHRYPSKEQYINDKGQYILRRFCGKTTDILIYGTDILQLKGIDVIAVSEDPNVTGHGALSRLLLDAGDKEYRKEHSNLQPFFSHSTSEVMLTSAGCKLPFHHVLHAVIRRTGEFETMFQRKLKETYTKILERANQLVNKSKSKKVSSTTINLALPMIGIGKLFVFIHCCRSVVSFGFLHQ
jgi:O-acetyl-ADP-ribose deacetylase (regulator of RNase III)